MLNSKVVKIQLNSLSIRAQLFCAVGFIALNCSELYGQQVVINNNAFLTIQNGAKFFIGNSSTNALLTMGTGGNIVSEEAQNQVIWNTKNAIGNFTIPFTTTPVSLGGNGTKIPLVISISGSGDVNGKLALSTYETDTDFNIPYPASVTSMNQINNTDGSLYTTDRFWIIENSTYTTKPTATLTLGYDDSENEIGELNLINEGELMAQRWNSTINSWESLQFGTVNTTTNTVSEISVTPTDFYEIWTLQSNSVPLNINFINFYKINENCQFEMGWEYTDLNNVDRFLIYTSNDAISWSIAEELDALSDNGKFVFTERNTISELVYYRISMVSQDGDYEELKIVAATNTCQLVHAKCFPNPFSEILWIETPEEMLFSLSSSIGVHLFNVNLSIGISSFDLSHLSSGTYFAAFLSADGSVQYEKIVKP
jgi:hypothetical protein